MLSGSDNVLLNVPWWIGGVRHSFQTSVTAHTHINTHKEWGMTDRRERAAMEWDVREKIRRVGRKKGRNTGRNKKGNEKAKNKEQRCLHNQSYNLKIWVFTPELLVWPSNVLRIISIQRCVCYWNYLHKVCVAAIRRVATWPESSCPQNLHTTTSSAPVIHKHMIKTLQQLDSDWV